MQTFKLENHTVQLYPQEHRPDAFWQLAGPVFGDREAQRQLGGPFTDDNHTAWVLAVADGALLGLASLRVEGGAALLDHAYVLPHARGQGVYRTLLAARVLAAPAIVRKFRVLSNGSSTEALIRRGFLANGKRGGYAVMEADAVLLRARFRFPQPVLH